MSSPATGKTTMASTLKSQDPEVRLMLRVRNDEPGAFAELIQCFWPKVFGRFYRLLANRQDAEDLVQEVFLRLYRARKRYKPSAKFNTWLYHIAQNVARNAIRSRRRKPLIGLGQLQGSEEQHSPLPQVRANAEDSPSHPLELLELASMVRAAVSDLGERQRTALELHQFQDQSYAEIAEQMEMSPKAAKSLLYRARLQLRSQLKSMVESE